MLALVVLNFDHFIWMQVSIYILSSLMQVCYLLHFKPALDRLRLKLEIFNELVILLVSYHLILFTTSDLGAWLSDPVARYYIGFILTYIVVDTTLINCIFIIAQIGGQLRLKYIKQKKLREHAQKQKVKIEATTEEL